MSENDQKMVVLEPGKPPRFTGSWTFQDFYYLVKFILEMPLVQPEKEV